MPLSKSAFSMSPISPTAKCRLDQSCGRAQTSFSQEPRLIRLGGVLTNFGWGFLLLVAQVSGHVLRSDWSGLSEVLVEGFGDLSRTEFRDIQLVASNI